MSSRTSRAAIYPQPSTPLRGGGLLAFDFEDVRRARTGAPGVNPQLRRLFSKRVSATRTGLYGRKRIFFALKPHRVSRGILFSPTRTGQGPIRTGQAKAFYWSPKGYYRPGRTGGPRRPLHHQIWELHSRQRMPPMHEVIFLNDDEHDFRPKNLKCMHKSDVHRRIIDLKGPAINKWMRTAGARLSHLLNRFASNERTYDSTIKFLGDRREQFHPQAAKH